MLTSAKKTELLIALAVLLDLERGFVLAVLSRRLPRRTDFFCRLCHSEQVCACVEVGNAALVTHQHFLGVLGLGVTEVSASTVSKGVGLERSGQPQRLLDLLTPVLRA